MTNGDEAFQDDSPLALTLSPQGRGKRKGCAMNHTATVLMMCAAIENKVSKSECIKSLIHFTGRFLFCQ